MARTSSPGERRSSGAPVGVASKVLQSIIEDRSSQVTITRPTTSTDSLDATTESTSTFTESMWLTAARENVSQIDAGELQSGDLMGFSVVPTDIQRKDRVTYGGVEYEVDTVVGRPDDNPADGNSQQGTDYYVTTFVRRN